MEFEELKEKIKQNHLEVWADVERLIEMAYELGKAEAHKSDLPKFDENDEWL
jgi:hypothetical protein